MSKPPAAIEPSKSITTNGPTLEQALYGLLLVAALFLRFFRLGTASLLNPWEAGQAWAAWAGAFGQEGMLAVTATSPLLYTGQRLLFWLTSGGGEGWARAWPALTGSLLVLLPWLLRERLGKPAALLLALLFATDPWLLTFSRTGDGAILSAGLALLLLAGMTGSDSLAPQAKSWLAVGTALFLLSGPLAWLLLPVLLWALLLFGIGGLWPQEQRERARFLTLCGVTILAGATGFLAYWEGMGHVSASLSAALSALTGDNGYPLGWAFLRLAVDQPLALLVGGTGLAVAWLAPRRSSTGGGDGVADGALSGNQPPKSAQSVPSAFYLSSARWRLFLTGWVFWGLFLLLLPGRNPTTLLVIGLPLLISAAQTGARLLAYATDRPNWQDGSLIGAVLLVILVTTFFWTSHYSSKWGQPDFDRLTLLFYGIVPLLAIFFVWWAGWRTSSQIFALLGLALLFQSSLSAGWSINLPGDTTASSALFAQTARPGLAALAGDIYRLSSLRALDPYEAPVLVDVERELRPLLGWTLRRMRGLRFVDGIDPVYLTDRAALVVADEAAALSLPGGYRGSHYPALQHWLPSALHGSEQTARWIVLRELKSTPPTTSVVLWAREE